VLDKKRRRRLRQPYTPRSHLTTNHRLRRHEPNHPFASSSFLARLPRISTEQIANLASASRQDPGLPKQISPSNTSLETGFSSICPPEFRERLTCPTLRSIHVGKAISNQSSLKSYLGPSFLPWSNSSKLLDQTTTQFLPAILLQSHRRDGIYSGTTSRRYKCPNFRYSLEKPIAQGIPQLTRLCDFRLYGVGLYALYGCVSEHHTTD
jgi:hypothetical protein